VEYHVIRAAAVKQINSSAPDAGPKPKDRSHETTKLDIPVGTYRLEWLHPLTGRTEKPERLKHPGGLVTFPSPTYSPDLALTLRREGR